MTNSRNVPDPTRKHMNDASAVVCTLRPQQLIEQVQEWHELASLAIATEHTPIGIVACYPVDLLATIEDLISRELACCGSWLRIEHERLGDSVRVEFSTESIGGQALLHSFTDQSEPAQP